jgi:Flp pilus assembly protein TadD
MSGDSRWLDRIWLAVLAAAGVVAYRNSFAGIFLFDDSHSIVSNLHLHTMGPMGRYLSDARATVSLSLALNYWVDGLNPWGYHLVNLTVHICAGLALYGVVRRTLVRAPVGGSARMLAGAIALVWLLHPLATESVTYVTQRAESLSGLFYLSTLYCMIRYCDEQRWRWAALSVVSCWLGMVTKPVMVTAPLVVLLYDRTYVAGSFSIALRRRRALYAGLFAGWIELALVMGHSIAGSEAGRAGFAYSGITPLGYALTQPAVILHYLRLSVWPWPLCLDYGWPPTATARAAAPTVAALVCLLCGTAWAIARRHAVAFCAGAFFLLLAPTSSVMPLQDLAVEHRMYLALAAVIAILLTGAWRWLGAERHPSLALGAVALVAIVEAHFTDLRNQDYRDEIRMWTQTIEAAPDSARPHANLGRLLLGRGERARAIDELERALALNPRLSNTHDVLGRALLEGGDRVRAQHEFQRAVELNPRLADAHGNLGLVLLVQGRTDDAAAELERALALDPRLAFAHTNLATILGGRGDRAGALEHLRAAIEIDPRNAAAHFNLGLALLGRGDRARAVDEFRRALELEPGDQAAAQILRSLDPPP